MENKFNVFVSYSRKDSEQVLSIVDKLEERGLTVWIDRDGIMSGDAFKSVIVQAIKNSDVFLFFSSGNSNTSPWTVKEVDAAVYLKKSIIPIRLDDTDYDDSILLDLSGLDFVDLRIGEKREDALNALINSLLSKVSALEIEQPIQKPGMTSPTNKEGTVVNDQTALMTAEECHVKGVECYESMRYEEASTWFRSSAERGNANAQCYLGYLYAHGLGVKKSDAEAAKWYIKAAEQGDALAQNNLGSMYREGKGVPKSVEESVRWFRVAAGQGHVLAQYNLAIMYQVGAGVKQDEAEAVKWYREAAVQGLPQAQYSLGNMYRTGNGVMKKDESEAVKWYKKAAEQGLADAQHNLGYMYYNGCGVEKDVAEAVKWLRLSADQGNDGSKEALKMIFGS